MLRTILTTIIALLVAPSLSSAEGLCSQIRVPVMSGSSIVHFNYPPGPIVAWYAQGAVDQGRRDIAECILVTANARVETYISSACALGRDDATLISNITAILAQECF